MGRMLLLHQIPRAWPWADCLMALQAEFTFIPKLLSQKQPQPHETISKESRS